MGDIEDDGISDVNIENIGFKRQKNIQPDDIPYSEKYEFMIDGCLFKIELEEDNLTNQQARNSSSGGVRLRNFLLGTKMFTAPGIGLKIDKYGHIVSVKDAAKQLDKSESTIRRWAKDLEQINDSRFRWDKRFGLLYYYAA